MISRMVSMLVAAFVFMLAETASAQRELPIPAEEWTAEARYNLARCLVGEAGWEAPDHSAIPWALARSWAARKRAGHELTFATQVHRYCAVLRVPNPTPRQRWVLALPETGPMTEENEPDAFPDNIAWSSYSERWDAVRAFVDRWAAGEVEDPCPRADHWGGTMDSIGSNAVIVCQRERGGMRNTFFRARSRRVAAR